MSVCLLIDKHDLQHSRPHIRGNSKHSAGILEHFMGARNRVRIELSYRPIDWRNRFLGSLQVKKYTVSEHYIELNSEHTQHMAISLKRKYASVDGSGGQIERYVAHSHWQICQNIYLLFHLCNQYKPNSLDKVVSPSDDDYWTLPSASTK